MITQEIKNKGISCRGRGFNCPTCISKVFCVEYEERTPMQKPPLGVTPKHIWQLQRVGALSEAMARYTNANKVIPTEWVTEYNELIQIEEVRERD